MSGYIGNIPVPQATQTRQTFTATASQTTFNTAGYSPGYIDVFLNGVKLAPADYTATNGSDVVLAVGAASGDILETVAYEIFQVLDQDFTGDFTVDTDTFVVDSVNDRVGVGTASPEKLLDVDGGAIIRGRLTLGDTTEYAGGTLYQSGGNTILRAGSTADSITLFNSGSSVTYAQFTPTYSYFSQNVGIGTTSPTHKAHISTTDSTPLSVEHSDGSDVYIKLVNNADGAGNFLGASSNNLTFWTENTERMRIDSSGRVMIGTTTEGHADGDNFTIAGSGNTGMTIRSTNAQKSTIYFSDSTSGSGEYAGYIHYDHSGDNLNIGVNGNERMRIDSSGNLLFAKTSTSSGVAGIRFAGDAPGYAEFTRDGGNPLFLNRETSDGYIIRFAKDNSYVGSIGTGSGVMAIAGPSDNGLSFPNNLVLPATSTAGAKDASTDLGVSYSRFKDLYLSGGVFLGGTGSSNKLDDYEEGTFTPVPSMTGNNLVYNLSGTAGSYGRYTKVGNLVTCWFDVYFNVTSGGTGIARLGGFPFSTSMSTSNGGYSAINIRASDALNATSDVHGYYWANSVYFEQYNGYNNTTIGYRTANNIRVTGVVAFYIS